MTSKAYFRGPCLELLLLIHVVQGFTPDTYDLSCLRAIHLFVLMVDGSNAPSEDSNVADEPCVPVRLRSNRSIDALKKRMPGDSHFSNELEASSTGSRWVWLFSSTNPSGLFDGAKRLRVRLNC
jgi:hypothetical protein